MTHNQDLDIMTRTVWGEARGECGHPKGGGLASLMAVANVIVNRSKHPKKIFGQTLSEICQKKYQFSCWLPKDPNYELLHQLDPMDGLYQKIYGICESVLSEKWPDVTLGANHYHSTSLRCLPQWTNHMECKGVIGRHVFYRV